jgi:hypothetical protein
VALHLGFDPGGTGRKIAHLAAAADGDGRLFVGHLSDGSFRDPGLAFGAFPYLDAATLSAIEARLRAVLRSLLAQTGTSPGVLRDPLALALDRFGAVIVSVDASAGFAAAGRSVRDTETCVGANVNTPDQETFLARTRRWVRAGNLPPLRQRVFWQLVGFAIYRFFTGAATGPELARAKSRGIRADLSVDADLARGVRVLEAFPSEIYRAAAGSPAMALARRFARRTLVNLPAAPLHRTTLALFEARLRQVAAGVPGAWARIPGRRVGDCLDAFAAMMMGPWAAERGLHARATSSEAALAEGAVILPGRAALPRDGRDRVTRERHGPPRRAG